MFCAFTQTAYNIHHHEQKKIHPPVSTTFFLIIQKKSHDSWPNTKSFHPWYKNKFISFLSPTFYFFKVLQNMAKWISFYRSKKIMTTGIFIFQICSFYNIAILIWQIHMLHNFPPLSEALFFHDIFFCLTYDQKYFASCSWWGEYFSCFWSHELCFVLGVDVLCAFQFFHELKVILNVISCFNGGSGLLEKIALIPMLQESRTSMVNLII